MTEGIEYRTKRLKYVASVEMGQSPPAAEYSLSPEIGLPFLQGTADFGAEHPTPKVYCSSATKLSSPGDILFSVRAPVGELNVADQIYGIGRGLCGIRVGEGLTQRFAWWALHVVRDHLNLEATGSTYDAVSAEDVANLRLPIPDESVQDFIGEYLDHETSRIDALIATKERLLELLAEKRRALITQSVTRGLNPNAPMRDSGLPWLGEIPRHWDFCLLKRHFHVALGKMLDSKAQSGPGTSRPYLRAANIHWGRVLVDDVNEMLFTDDERTWYRLRKGDLLVTEGGVTVGRSAIWQDELPECYYQNSLNRVRPKKDASPKLLYYWLYALKLNGYIDLLASKATFGHLTKEMLEELPVLFVPPNEADQIVTFLESEEEKINASGNFTERTIDLLRERRIALIAAAVTGKIEVGSIESAVPA